MFQDMRNKLYSWIVFRGDEMQFECERCKKKIALDLKDPKEQAAKFADTHKGC